MAFRDWQKPSQSRGKARSLQRMGWPSWGRVARRPYREFPGKGRLGRLLWRRNGPGGLVYESWVDEAGRGPGKKIPRIPERYPGRAMTTQSTCPNGQQLLAEWERLRAQWEEGQKRIASFGVRPSVLGPRSGKGAGEGRTLPVTRHFICPLSLHGRYASCIPPRYPVTSSLRHFYLLEVKADEG